MALLPATSLRTLRFCCLCFRSSASQVSLRAYYSSHSPNHDWLAKLRYCRTICVEQSSCCTMETRDDSAHFQVTTEGLSVPRLMCWQTKGTFTTARHCCGVFVILVLDKKLQTYLLTYLPCWSSVNEDTPVLLSTVASSECCFQNASRICSLAFFLLL